MKTLEKNICQRWSESMNHLTDFGYKKDGTINTDYCRSCYSRGVFVDRGISLEERIEKNLSENHLLN
jgi:hypothetical protein